MKTLTSILHPYSVDRFLSENWTQRGVLIPSEQPDKFQHLFSWQQLNDLLNFHELRHPELRFLVDGKVLPACDSKDWIKHCQQGATIAINHVHARVPMLAALIWALQQEIGHSRVHLNTYCSWPSQQGFNCHYDTHEVFILQIDGQKEWFVFEDTIKYPLKKEFSDYQSPPEGSPYIHCVLNPGDVLYIPRGHWHYAVAVERPSLHLTLGIRCFTGNDLLDWLVEEIHEQEAWRLNLPLVSDGDNRQLEERVEDLFECLAATLREGKEKLAQRYAKAQTMTSTRTPEISLPGQVGFGIFERGLETRFRQPKFQKVRVESNPETGFRILTANKTVNFKKLEPNLVKNLVKNLFSYETFTVKDVVKWLPEYNLENQIMPLLSDLTKVGMIQVDQR